MPEDTTPAQVHLLRVPVQVRARSTQHGEELLRELALVSIGAEAGSATAVPRRLLDLAGELRATYGPLVQHADDRSAAAEAQGETHIDLTFPVPAALGDLMRRIHQVLRDVEDYCREGGALLTLQPPPEVVAYREWVFGEIERQLAGAAPTPWRDPA